MVTAYYDRKSCGGEEAIINPVAIDVKKWLGAVTRVGRALFDGKIKPIDLDADLIALTYGQLSEAAQNGWGDNYDEEVKKKGSLSRKLDEHIFLFSGVKTYQNMVAMNDMLVDSDGKILPWSDFKTEVLKLHDTYNVNYLATEYQTANRSAQAARQWQTFEDNSDLFPNLKYRTIGDKRVRDEHDKLDNIIKSIKDPFWDSHYPPNGWNCRCYVQSNDDAVTKGTPKVTVENGFKNNVGKTGKVFDDDGHPYFKVPKKDLKTITKNLSDGKK